MKELVLYSGAWCAPCKMLKNTLEELSKEGVEFTLENVDIDENPERTQKARVRGVPTLHLVEDGKVVGSMIGNKTLTDLKVFMGIV